MEDNIQEEIQKEKLPNYTLFGGAIGYDSPSDYVKFIQVIDKQNALHMLINAVNYAQSKGIFNLKESEVLAVSVRAFVDPVLMEEKPITEPQ